MSGDDPVTDVLKQFRALAHEEQVRVLQELIAVSDDRWLTEPPEIPQPTLLKTPRKAKGFKVRVDLLSVKPPIWRRLILPGDVTLDRLHDVLQEAIGWTDSHLHRFRTGRDPRAPYFLTDWDLSEGEVGTFEGDVRLDEVLAEEGDALWYEYDFGDGWEHILVVEEVLQVPPDAVELLAGRRACPPEDVGGTWAYAEVADWVANGHDEDSVPEMFTNAEHALGWLPDGWRPEVFDLEATREAISRLARRS